MHSQGTTPDTMAQDMKFTTKHGFLVALGWVAQRLGLSEALDRHLHVELHNKCRLHVLPTHFELKAGTYTSEPRGMWHLLSSHEPRRNANSNGMARHVVDDNPARTDTRPFADRHPRDGAHTYAQHNSRLNVDVSSQVNTRSHMSIVTHRAVVIHRSTGVDDRVGTDRCKWLNHSACANHGPRSNAGRRMNVGMWVDCRHPHDVREAFDN